jgi:hypothetical protein
MRVWAAESGSLKPRLLPPSAARSAVPQLGMTAAVQVATYNHVRENEMNLPRTLGNRLVVLCTITCLLALYACNYDVPITSAPTHPIDKRLIGSWSLKTPGQKTEQMTIRPYDDSNYVVWYDGDLYRAYHSDVAGMPLISAQNLNDSERKYLYLAWKLSEDGKRLTIRAVSTDVIPTTEKDSAAIVKLLEANRDKPQLFGESADYTRDR